MLGFNALAIDALSMGSDAFKAVVTPPPPAGGDPIDAAKVPLVRWIKFEGTKRTIAFQGTSRVIPFEGTDRHVEF